MKKKTTAKKKTAPKKAKTQCTSLVCKLMMGPKGRAFGKAGTAFYGEYLKIAKKEKNKAAAEDLAHAIMEMTAMAKGKLCGCTPTGCGSDCENSAEGCNC